MPIVTRSGKGSALTHAEMDGNLGYLVPPGAVMAFARNSAPDGWVECNGGAISRTVYADLFAAIGTTFGAGNGSTTFNVPNLRGEFIRGWDNGRGVDSGRTFGSAQADEVKSHSHNILPGFALNARTGVAGGPNTGVFADGGAANTANGGGAESRPRNIAMLYCIKV